MPAHALLQVGQAILSLPHSLSQTGMVAGIIIEVVFATLAMWTVYLMVLLYLDHKNRKVRLQSCGLHQPPSGLQLLKW